MEHCGSEAPTSEQIQNGRRRVKLQETQLPLEVAQNLLSEYFPCSYFCAENFLIFFFEIKLLFTLLTYLWATKSDRNYSSEVATVLQVYSRRCMFRNVAYTATYSIHDLVIHLRHHRRDYEKNI